MIKYKTYKEWMDSTKNNICESSLYTENNVYRLGQDRTFKKAINCLLENNIKTIRFYVIKEKYNTIIERFKKAGYKLMGTFEEETLIDVYMELE